VIKLVKKEYICPPGKESKIVIEDFSIEIKEKSTMILGFAENGLLGTIIVNTIIDQISDMREIGFISNNHLPPISICYNGELKHPFRLYYTPKYNIIIGTCETTFRKSSDYNDLARTICNWLLSEDVNAEEIVMFQSILTKEINKEYPIYYATENNMVEFLENYNIYKVKKGIIRGPEACIINEALTSRLNIYTLFVSIHKIPSLQGTAAIIDVLNKIYCLNINTQKLIEKGKKIESKYLEYINKVRKNQDKRSLSQEVHNIYR
jgi:uncharacterized protein